MAAQLKNILNFVNIPVGGSQVLPHGLNNNFKKLVPDILTPGGNGGSATITADNTNVTVTNISADPLSLEVLCEAWHTIERAFGPRQVTALAPQPFVVGSSGGAQNAATQFVFVYRQGGIAGGNVYTDWATLIAAKSLVQGVKYLQIDSTIQIQGTTLLPGTLSFAAGTVTYTAPAGAPAIPTTVVGQAMTIAGASVPGNNGNFFVATRISAQQITYANASGANENPFLGVMTILGGFTNIIPAAGMPVSGWDMTDTEMCGFHSPIAVGGAGGQLVSFGGVGSGGDVQFSNWRKLGCEVAITNNNVAIAANIIPAGGAIFEFGMGFTGDFPQLANKGTAPMWDCSALLANQSFTFRMNGVLGAAGDTASSIAFGASPGILNLSLYGQTRITANSFTGTNAAAAIAIGYAGPLSILNEQANWAGIGQALADFQRMQMVPLPLLLNAAPVATTIALTLALNQLALYNTTAGDIAQSLPVIRPAAPPATGSNASLNSIGIPLMIKNLTGANNVNVSPGAGNTIDGGAGPVAIAAGKMGKFWSDGFSNWIQELP